MGWQDRDYSRAEDSYRYGPRPSVVGAMRMWSVTTWLIAINIAVFVLDPVLMGMGLGYGNRVTGWIPPLFMWGHFSEATAIGHFQLWRFISFQFLHGGLTHVLFNMLALYFFGPMVEAYLSSRRYLVFYLLCGIAGPVVYLGLWMMGMLHAGAHTPLVGASAGIFGVLIAASRIAPDTTVMLMFPPIPMKLKVMAWVFIGIAAYTVLTGGHNAGGEAAHLGGAAAGWVLIQNPRVLSWLDPTRLWRKRGPRFVR